MQNWEYWRGILPAALTSLAYSSHSNVLVTPGFCSSLYIISQSGLGCNSSLSFLFFGKMVWTNSSFVIFEASSQDNLILSVTALIFLIVLRDVDNSLDISFCDIPNDRYLKICLYFSSYSFKTKNSFRYNIFVDSLPIYNSILHQKEYILYDWST